MDGYAHEVQFERLRRPYQLTTRELVEVLDNLGRLPPDIDPTPLLELVEYPDEQVRFYAVKNLAKLRRTDLLPFFFERGRNEPSTLVRREYVSAIGRLRVPDVIPFLLVFLDDPDPKIVVQAIRGLLYFRDYPDVQSRLRSLCGHPSELVRRAVEPLLKTEKTAQRRSNHVQSPEWLHNKIVNADVLEVLKHVPDESVHLTFTSPPYYNARDYTIYQSYQGYLQFLATVFKEVHRITKEGRFFVLNTSPILIPRMSRQHASTRYLIPFDIHPLITEIGFDFIDDIIWVKPEPSAKNRNGGFFQHRKPLGYKTNSVVEYVIVYRKHTDKLIDWNMRQYDEETVEASRVSGDYEKTNLWRIAPSADPVHPAVFPVELAARIIQLYSYRGDLVFDPFAGRGTVGIAALQLGRYFFLTEKHPAYANYARQLLSEGSLFCDKPVELLTLEEFIQLKQQRGEQ
ncbi:MAG: HEAT repeat domain-containing protein [Chthonomonadetes bacterium]|nr:HEAT repeat domain-containing protein [Chthonomonadetes bacterium]